MFDMENCPFCTSKQTRVLRVQFTSKSAVECLVCGAYGPLSDSYNGAVVAWNERSEPISEDDSGCFVCGGTGEIKKITINGPEPELCGVCLGMN